jgi:hypothetical protein
MYIPLAAPLAQVSGIALGNIDSFVVWVCLICLELFPETSVVRQLHIWQI